MNNTLNNWHNKNAFELIFKEYYEALCTYVFGIVKDYDLSEEIVQDLFVKLWINRKTTPITTSLKSYLYRAVKNLALNHINHIDIKEKYKKHNKLEINYAEQNTYNTLEEKELADRIKTSISKLPTERQKIFLLSRNEGKKYKEIAEELNISIKTVENQMGKALSTLRNDLSEYMPLIVVSILLGLN